MKTLTDKRMKMDICILREMLYKKEVKDIGWVKSKQSLDHQDLLNSVE